MGDTEGTQYQAAFANYNVTATFDNNEKAHQAVERLEIAGVSPSDLSLLGPSGQAAADVRDTSYVDEAVISEGIKSTLGGAAAGSGFGAVVGFLGGAAVFGIPGFGPAVAAGIWATTLGGVAAGGGIGFTASAIAEMKQSQVWELTLQDVGGGNFVVGAHTDDWQEFERARNALAACGASRMREFDRKGDEVSLSAE